jgi:hypothetical protein
MPRVPSSGAGAQKQCLARRNPLRPGTRWWDRSTLQDRPFLRERRIYTAPNQRRVNMGGFVVLIA